MGFRIIEDVASGDFMFEAGGETLQRLFESCAAATFSAMTDPAKVNSILEHNIAVWADSLEELLVDFLSELIYLKDTEKIFFTETVIDLNIDDISLKAVARGEKIDYGKHEIRADVKAVTYHDLKIAKNDKGYRVRVILDL